MPPDDDFQPTASLEVLRFRALVLSELRTFFNECGYWEVETPILSRDIVVDANLHPFVAHWQPDETEETGNVFYLQTSPEFAMKRLLASGAEAIFQVSRVFRNGERGPLHNPEFTLIEWYRVGDTHREQMQFVQQLVRRALDVARSHRPARDDASDDVLNRMNCVEAYACVTYDAAFERVTGTRVLHLDCEQLADLARRNAIVPPPGLRVDDRDGWLNLLLAELVQPTLGRERPEFLVDYPASQAALAKVRQDSVPVAERFELFVDGIELCNGYHELTDADELRARQEYEAAQRAAEGHPPLPQENRLLDAMQAGLPECAGVALGFDRLLMLLCGATRIEEVLAFPFGRA